MTLTLRRPVASGKYKCIYPLHQEYNYKIENDKFLVQHHIKTDVWIHLDRKDIHLDKNHIGYSIGL